VIAGTLGAAVGGLAGMYTTGATGGALLGAFVCMVMTTAIANSRVGTVWLRVNLAACRLASHRKLPLRLAAFLNEMHDLGLLRVSGSAYQFRHFQIQEFLCDSNMTDDETEQLAGWFGLQVEQASTNVEAGIEGVTQTATE
jgi:hypothetical protein